MSGCGIGVGVYRPLASSGFSPLDLPSTEVWGEANMTGADLVLASGKVTTIGKSSLIQATQGTDSKRWLFVEDAGDGLPEMTSDGVDDQMVAPSVNRDSNFTYTSVWRASNVSKIMEFGANKAYIYTSTGATFWVNSTVATWKNLTGNWGSDNTYRITSFQWDATAASLKCWINGVETAMSFGVSADGGNSETANLTIGSSASASFMAGAHRAFVWNNSYLTSEQIGDLHTYLNGNWSVF